MEKFFTLNTQDLSDFYFENAQLIGISTDLAPIDFCSLMNRKFRFNLRRQMDCDLKKSLLRQKKDTRPSLFEEQDQNTAEVYFPVYTDFLPSSETEIILYCNVVKNHVFEVSQKSFQFFLLIKNGQFVDYLNPITSHFSNIQQILFHKTYVIEKEKWRDNLIL